MASEKQEQANRANAKRSTGPQTAVGKAQSRMNACKHGLTAQNIVIGDEDPKNFDRLRAQLWDEWQPRPGMEGVLVDRLAGQIWRLLRVPGFEAAPLNVRCADVAASEDYLGRPQYKPEHYMGQALMHDAQHGDTLGKLSRYDAALMNGYTKTLQMLLALQSRRAEEDNAPSLIDALPTPPKSEENGALGVIGFVFVI